MFHENPVLTWPYRRLTMFQNGTNQAMTISTLDRSLLQLNIRNVCGSIFIPFLFIKEFQRFEDI